MLQILGTCTAVESETVSPPEGNPFEVTTVHIMSAEGRTDYVRVGRNFAGELPTPGESVALGVWVRPYVNKSKDTLGYGLTAFARVALAPPVPVAV